MAASVGRFVIVVVAAMILARLPSSEQFGTFAMAMIAFGLQLPGKRPTSTAFPALLGTGRLVST